ncbi:DUF4401 domain-containing protein [Psychrobacter sp. APC 3350]|uniref:DUF4401 domain-containing protein n=1 Tax=Psychrobacter sp. APC 3350 TaxID=3035195 RepID=UPI0025B391DB|nr:DUF4401 domain-containing protein [Psychrobacter sp. APC 3350]MDN3453540.1 DUF4401 domain-containing protein [Psychrobacter sp. APC 3350]
MNDDKQTLIALKNLGLIDTDVDNVRLVDENNTTVDSDSRSAVNDDHPWFLQLFFGVSGMVASLFFIGFLSLLLENTGVLDSMIAVLIIGSSLNGAGFMLFKHQQNRDNAFISSLAFAISVVGQAYIAYALFSNNLPTPIDIYLFLLTQGFMTLVMSNYVYRILGSVVTLSLMVYLLNYYHLPELSLGLLALIAVISNLQRHRLLQRTPVKWHMTVFATIKAVGYASALMLLAVSVYFIAAEYGRHVGSYGEALSYNYYLAQGLLIFASLYAAYLILKRYHVKLQSVAGRLIVGIIILLGILSIYVSGLLATSLVIIIAVANSQRALLGLGIAALVGYVFWYYYQLDTSLLIKSVSMLIIGLTMLMIRWRLRLKRDAFNSTKYMNSDEQKERLL